MMSRFLSLKKLIQETNYTKLIFGKNIGPKIWFLSHNPLPIAYFKNSFKQNLL